MSTEGFHQRGSVVLECRHTIILVLPLPVKGDHQFCRYCNDWRIVDETHESFIAKCNTGKCRLSKNTGADKEAALAVARRHVQKYSRHKVTIFDGRLSIAEVTNMEETLFVTAADRNAIAAESQKLLRNLGLGSGAGT